MKLPYCNAVKVQVAVANGVNPRAAMNIFHVVGGVFPVSNTTLEAIGTEFETAYRARFGPSMAPNTCSIPQVIVTDLSSATGGQVTITGGSTFGANVEPLPDNCCSVASWHIDLRRRGGHPRSYIPFQQKDNTANSYQWDTGYITAFAADCNGFITDISGASIPDGPWVLACVSYFDAKLVRPSPELFPIGTATVDERIDTQRKRLGKL